MSRLIKIHPNFGERTLTVSLTGDTFIIDTINFDELAQNLRGQDVKWARGWTFDKSGYMTNKGVSVYPDKPFLFYLSSSDRLRTLAKIEKEFAQ